MIDNYIYYVFAYLTHVGFITKFFYDFTNLIPQFTSPKELFDID